MKKLHQAAEIAQKAFDMYKSSSKKVERKS